MKLDPNETNGTSPPVASELTFNIAMREDDEICIPAKSDTLPENDSTHSLATNAGQMQRLPNTTYRNSLEEHRSLQARFLATTSVVAPGRGGSMNKSQPRRIRAWFDGACEPRNPGGHASWGAVIEVDGQIISSKHGYVGSGPEMSSNVAEYCGCIDVLEEILKHEGEAIIFGDSMLVIKQMSGRWGVRKGGLYLPYLKRAKKILESVGKDRVQFQWIPREQNGKADALSKQALLDVDIVPVQHKKWSKRKRRAVAAWKKRRGYIKKQLPSHPIFQEESGHGF